MIIKFLFFFFRFCWVMGVSIAISLRSQLRSSTKRKYVFGRVVRRSIALLIMGLVLNSVNNNNLSTFRPLGVLQRLAFVYFIAATLETIFMKPQPYFTVICLKLFIYKKIKKIFFLEYKIRRNSRYYWKCPAMDYSNYISSHSYYYYFLFTCAWLP